MHKQTLFNIILGIAAFTCGFFVKVQYDATQELARGLTEIKVDLPKNYVSKADLQRSLDQILNKLDRIENKMDQKQDKVKQ